MTRGDGATSRQMQGAPFGAVYIWLNDMRRMTLIDVELQAFVENELKLRAAKGTRQ
jgi:hypothetical protein